VIQIKRTYDPPARQDGWRILVERLWPRGMTKEAVAADAWMKEVAPSTELRKWFDHREERWEEFRRRYREELGANPEGWKAILDESKRRTVTLLYSAHDRAHNGAAVLRDYLAALPASRRASDRPRISKAPRAKKSSATTRRRRPTRTNARVRHRAD
jgi:uncharacterized protein YeaO (DUF488 family)